MTSTAPTSTDLLTTAVPTVDLSLLESADPATRAEALTGLREAAHRVGFLQLVGHGVPQQQADDLLALTRAFFALPETDRRALDNRESPHFRGYTVLGQEHTGGVPDRRDQLDVGAEREPLALRPGDPAYLRLVGPNRWPDTALPALRPAVLAWADALQGVARRFLRALAASLEVDPALLDPPLPGGDEAPAWHLKLARYPGSAEAGGQGVGAHKDYGWLALLLQDEHGGLQVQPPAPVGTEQGTPAAAQPVWLDVPPTRGALVVNLGEMLEVATGGYLTATLHRVVVPPAGVERVSVPYFWAPGLATTVAPLPLPPHLAAHARGVAADPANPLLAAYGANALKGWLRAHPEAARRHHPDLLTA